MKVEMYGRNIVVIYKPGTKYEFRVYEVNHLKEKHHLESFESFQEAMEFVTHEIYA